MGFYICLGLGLLREVVGYWKFYCIDFYGSFRILFKEWKRYSLRLFRLLELGYDFWVL